MFFVETKSLNIRPTNDDDLLVLYNWRVSSSFLSFCSTRRNSVDFESFKKELSKDFSRDRYEQLIAFQKNSNPVGTIWSYSMNMTDGHVFITTFIDHPYKNLGYGVELFAAKMFSLFERFDFINKIYTEVYSYNTNSLQIMKKFGFLEEGYFPEHRIFNNQRHGLYRLAFYRRQYNEKSITIKKLIRLYSY